MFVNASRFLDTTLMRPEPRKNVIPCCPPLLHSDLGEADAEGLAATFKALGDPARLRILSAIAAQPDADPRLLAELKEWRLQLARANGVPAYTIFTDRTLTEIAARKPATRSDLHAIHGVGDAKLERWADDVLEIVASRGSGRRRG